MGENYSTNEKMGIENQKETDRGQHEEYKPKWYFSYPVLIALYVFCFPISFILSLLRLRQYKRQKKGYRFRSFLAVGINLAMVLIIGYNAIVSGKWDKDYNKYIKNGDYSQAKYMLDERYKDTITVEAIDRYLEVFGLLDNYDGLDRIILTYYHSLEDKTKFDENIIQKIDAVSNRLNEEQREVINGVRQGIEQAKIRKEEEESRAIVESESKKEEEESRAIAESESKKAAEEEQKRIALEESTETSEQESSKSAEEEKQEIREVLAEYIETSKKKHLKELREKDKQSVWEILKEEYVKESVAKGDLSSSMTTAEIKKYCEMYQEVFPESNDEVDRILEDIQNIDGLDTKIRSIKTKYSYELSTAIESLSTYDWYVQKRLTTQYEDTISGAIMKEIDSYQKGNDSEWLAYNVEYYLGTAMPGENAVILHSNELNPFSQSGAYTLNCILSSQKKTLVDSSGFQCEAPVYEIVSDQGALVNDYYQVLELESQIERFRGQIEALVKQEEAPIEQDLLKNDTTDAEIKNGGSEKVYAIPLDDIFPSDLTQIVSWHSESTGYYMIPMMSDGEPIIYFSAENDTINASLAYGVMIDSVGQNENGGVVCRGRMYPYTKSFGSGEEEVNGTIEVTWSSLESMDFPSVRMIDGHQMTDVSMIADDYSYYGLVE